MVCKSGRCCHPRWMGSGDGLRDVREKWGAVKFVPPPIHTLLSAFFSLSLSLASASAIPLVSNTPNKICPTIVLHLPTLLCDLLLFLPPPLSACHRFIQQRDLSFASLPPPGHVQVIPTFFYSPQNSLTPPNTKARLIGELCFYLIIWEEVIFCCCCRKLPLFSLKVSISSLPGLL